MKAFKISINFLFLLLGFSLKSQCIDTNTLLDSIHTITLQDVNEVYEIFLSSKRNEEYLKGAQYQPLIEHKVFANWIDTLMHTGADSNLLFYRHVKHHLEDMFIQVKTDGTKLYKIAIYDGLFSNYMFTLSPSLQIIDFLAWDAAQPTIYNANTGESHTSGIKSNIKDGLILQEYYVVTAYKNRKAPKKTVYKRKRFVIDPSGKFVETSQ